MTLPALRLLLVDDSPLQLQFLREQLAGHDFLFLTAPDGARAVAIAAALQIDLVLMDLEMPGMNGLEAAAAIRANPDTAALPIIMVTSRSEAEAMERAFTGGCNDYVLKPAHRAELLAKIAALAGPAEAS